MSLGYLISKRRPYYQLFIGSAALAFFILGYTLVLSYVQKVDVIGETLTDTEFPPPSTSPIFFKPITWLMILSIIGWFSFVEMVKDRVRSKEYGQRSIILLLLLLISIFSLYEVFFNFMIWGVILGHQDPAALDPDKAFNTFPTDKYKINLVVATKFYFTTFACSLYGLVVFFRS